MKKLLSITCCLTGLLAFGQIGKGTFSLSGTGGYSGSKDSYVPQAVYSDGIVLPDYPYNIQNVNLSPAIGYFVSNKGQLVLRGIFGYQYVDAKPSYIRDIETIELGAMIGYQHYFSLSEKLYFAPTVYGSLSKTTRDYIYDYDELVIVTLAYSKFGFGVIPELIYGLSDRWYLGLSMGEVAYQGIRGKEYETGDGSRVRQKQDKLNVGLDFNNIQFSIQFLLNKSKKEEE